MWKMWFIVLLDNIPISQITYMLLMQEFNAKLSDFGLVKAGPTGDMTHVTTRVFGTEGYAAPEYCATGLPFCLHFN